MKRSCQSCAKEIPVDVYRCPYCGTIQSSSGVSIRKKSSGIPARRLLLIVLLGLLGAGIVIAFYWKYKVQPRLEGLGVIGREFPEIDETRKIEEDTSRNFVQKVKLPVDPLGFTFGNAEYVLGSRNNPPGFVRMKPAKSGKAFAFTTVPVLESAYSQRITFNAVTWNGKEYVTVAMGAWFQSSSDSVFVRHEPNSYKIISTTPAPPQIGCLTYDGSSYWGATRSNTQTSGEAVFLYQFDADFQEINRYSIRTKGCQGLVWDGQYLWMADVFDDVIEVLDISGETPSVVQRIPTDFSYLSGIAFDGRDIWVSEYDNKEIHRLNPAVKESISGAAPAPTTIPSMVLSSEQKLEDSYVNDSPEYPEEDVDVHEFRARVENGTVYASWKIHFGNSLFNSSSESTANEGFSMPLFARYTVSIKGPGMIKEASEVYDAHPGMNEKNDASLLQITERGEYDVSLFIHVQYVRPDGGNQILNKSAMPLRLNYIP